MKLSVCINTCALAPNLNRRSAGGHTYTSREDLLELFILPQLRNDPHVSEIIIAGDYREGEGYTYVHAPGLDNAVWDACFPKHAAAKVASGDMLLFLCDDHRLLPTFTSHLLRWWSENLLWDVLSPNRFVRDPGGVAHPVATGWNEGYVHMHGVVLRPHVLDMASWKDIWARVRHVWGWDVPLTHMWKSFGMHIQTDPGLLIEDVEDGHIFTEAKALYGLRHLILDQKPSSILELGSGLDSTLVLMEAAQKVGATFTTVDINLPRSLRHGISVQGDAEAYCDALEEVPDLVFVDAGDTPMRVRLIEKLAHRCKFLVAHDIGEHTHPEIREAILRHGGEIALEPPEHGLGGLGIIG